MRCDVHSPTEPARTCGLAVAATPMPRRLLPLPRCHCCHHRCWAHTKKIRLRRARFNGSHLDGEAEVRRRAHCCNCATNVHAKLDRRVATKPHVVFPGPAPAAASKQFTAPPPHQMCRCCCRGRTPTVTSAQAVCVRETIANHGFELCCRAPACFPTAFWPKGGARVLRASRLRRAPNPQSRNCGSFQVRPIVAGPDTVTVLDHPFV